MARVQYVGIRAYRMKGLPTDVLNYGLVLYAGLDDGTLIEDPAGYTTTFAPGDQAWTLTEFKAHAIMGVHGLSATPDARRNQWARVLEALRAAGIATDAETLMSLEYEVIVDDEVAQDFDDD